MKVNRIMTNTCSKETEVDQSNTIKPVLANIFMGFHESKWLNEYNL